MLRDEESEREERRLRRERNFRAHRQLEKWYSRDKAKQGGYDAPMLKRLSVRGFKRHFQAVHLELGKVNFILGPNNSGKSSLMEALEYASFLQRRGDVLGVESKVAQEELGVDVNRLNHSSKQSHSFDYSLGVTVTHNDEHIRTKIIGDRGRVKMWEFTTENLACSFGAHLESANWKIRPYRAASRSGRGFILDDEVRASNETLIQELRLVLASIGGVELSPKLVSRVRRVLQANVMTDERHLTLARKNGLALRIDFLGNILLFKAHEPFDASYTVIPESAVAKEEHNQMWSQFLFDGAEGLTKSELANVVALYDVAHEVRGRVRDEMYSGGIVFRGLAKHDRALQSCIDMVGLGLREDQQSAVLASRDAGGHTSTVFDFMDRNIVAVEQLAMKGSPWAAELELDVECRFADIGLELLPDDYLIPLGLLKDFTELQNQISNDVARYSILNHARREDLEERIRFQQENISRTRAQLKALGDEVGIESKKMRLIYALKRAEHELKEAEREMSLYETTKASNQIGMRSEKFDHGIHLGSGISRAKVRQMSGQSDDSDLPALISSWDEDCHKMLIPFGIRIIRCRPDAEGLMELYTRASGFPFGQVWDCMLANHESRRVRDFRKRHGLRVLEAATAFLGIGRFRMRWHPRLGGLRLSCLALDDDLVFGAVDDAAEYISAQGHSWRSDRDDFGELRFGDEFGEWDSTLGQEERRLRREDVNGGEQQVDALGRGSRHVIQCLLACFEAYLTAEGAVVILEEPSAFMHPEMAEKFTEVIRFVAVQFGVQIVVETHNEIMIRSLATAKLEKNLDDDVCIFYLDQREGDDTSIVKKIRVTEDGRFEPALPDGFLDKAAKMRRTQRRLRSKPKSQR